MQRLFCSLVITVVLAACGSAPSSAVTAQSVIDRFKEFDPTITNIEPRDRETDSPLPNSWKEDLLFDVPALGQDAQGEGKGGQVFVCDTKKNCDAIFAYFDALKALAGPYLYQSPNGTVVVQLNSGLAPEEAAKYEAVVKALP